jgi:hypothetical protein
MYIYIYIYIYIFGLVPVPAFFSPVSASAATTCCTETPTFALPELLILRLELYLFERKNKATTCVPADSKCKPGRVLLETASANCERVQTVNVIALMHLYQSM